MGFKEIVTVFLSSIFPIFNFPKLVLLFPSFRDTLRRILFVVLSNLFFKLRFGLEKLNNCFGELSDGNIRGEITTGETGSVSSGARRLSRG